MNNENINEEFLSDLRLKSGKIIFEFGNKSDYFGQINFNDGKIEYSLSGHGIGFNLKEFLLISELMANINDDVKRFGGPINYT